MDLNHAEPLPTEQEIALGFFSAGLRPAIRTMFALDRRLARIAGSATEPMLAQMRLAWWRDMLGKTLGDRPKGDAVLDAIGEYWAGEEAALCAMVDGWEEVVANERIGPAHIKRFAFGRAKPYVALFPTEDLDLDARLYMAAARYAFADAASHVSNEIERELLITYGLGGSCPDVPLPRSLRGLAVLEALALRALRRGGRPLMEGRGAALLALRVGLFGR